MYALAALMVLFFFSKSMASSGAPHISDALVFTSINRRMVESTSMHTRSSSWCFFCQLRWRIYHPCCSIYSAARSSPHLPMSFFHAIFYICRYSVDFKGTNNRCLEGFFDKRFYKKYIFVAKNLHISFFLITFAAVNLKNDLLMAG